MKRIFRAVPAALLALIAGAGARAAAPPALLPPIAIPLPASSAAASQAPLFTLGYALQTPAAQSALFLADVKALRFAQPGEEAAQSTALLARQAKDLRRAELLSYKDASRMLRSLSAPPPLQTWADGTVHLLTLPQIVSDEAKPYVKSDPPTAAILATIDEAEAVKIIADRSAPSLQAWLKLTQGGAGVWVSVVGRLAANMQASAATGQTFLLPREAVRHLRATAPPGTPLSVLRTLSALAPRGKGNLSSLIRLSDVSVPADQIAPAAQSFLEAYNAQALAAELSLPARQPAPPSP